MGEREKILVHAESQDKELKTHEMHQPNDYYGHASMLKRYAGCPRNYAIKGVIEHGSRLRHRIWDLEINAPLPMYFVFSPHRSMLAQKHTNKIVVPIGPIIHYADSSREEEGFSEEKRRLGRNVTLFPAHSTHWVDINYDVDRFLSEVRNICSEWDTLTVCLYWKDVLRGLHEAYRKQGCRVITSGHIYNKNFLNRLRRIIELSDLTFSNIFSTPAVYSTHLDVPHTVIEQDLSFDMHADVPRPIVKPEEEAFYEAQRVFLQPVAEVSGEQREVAKQYFGADCAKSREDLGLLLDAAERLHRKGGSYVREAREMLFDVCEEYEREGGQQQSRNLIRMVEMGTSASPAMELLSAKREMNEGRLLPSLKLIKSYLKTHPGSQNAKRMFADIAASMEGSR